MGNWGCYKWSCGPPTYLKFRSCTFYIVDFTEIRFSWNRRYWKSFDNCVVLYNSSFDRSCVLQIRKGIWSIFSPNFQVNHHPHPRNVGFYFFLDPTTVYNDKLHFWCIFGTEREIRQTNSPHEVL